MCCIHSREANVVIHDDEVHLYQNGELDKCLNKTIDESRGLLT